MTETRIITVWALPSGRWANFGEPRGKDEALYERFCVALPADWHPYFSVDHGAVLRSASGAFLGAVTVARLARNDQDGFRIVPAPKKVQKGEEVACAGI